MPARDWHDFEWLIGHEGSALLRGPFARIRRLKPAQIADLLESASAEEETEILGRVRADPELEADVFEELDEDLATRLLGARTDFEIAEVLARMRADDAADAIAELPQQRRQPVLDLLPPGPRQKVLTLMGFASASAGGLMGVDFIALPGMVTVRGALARVRESPLLQPEALTSVHAVDEDGCLRGVARLVTLVQGDPDAALIEVCDTDPIRVGADTDITDVAVLMTDYNLITIPVVDDRHRLLGVITVDDVLEIALPPDWRRREAAPPPAPADLGPAASAAPVAPYPAVSCAGSGPAGMFGELFTQSSMVITRRRLISRFESGKIRSVRRVYPCPNVTGSDPRWPPPHWPCWAPPPSPAAVVRPVPARPARTRRPGRPPPPPPRKPRASPPPSSRARC